MCGLPNGHFVVFAKGLYVLDPSTGESQQVGADWGDWVAAALDGPVQADDVDFGVFAVTKHGWSGKEGKLWHIGLHKSPDSSVYSQAVVTELTSNEHLGTTLQVVIANQNKYFWDFLLQWD